MEVKIISSARPLQIQRSVEGQSTSDGPPVAPTTRSGHAKEFYNEEIHSRTSVRTHRPLTPSEAIRSADLFRIVVFTLFVLASTFFCILTEDEVSLAYILPLISVISLVTFYLLKL
jgi:hypothetical protein